jgi:hypothetical protein
MIGLVSHDCKEYGNDSYSWYECKDCKFVADELWNEKCVIDDQYNFFDPKEDFYFVPCSSFHYLWFIANEKKEEINSNSSLDKDIEELTSANGSLVVNQLTANILFNKAKTHCCIILEQKTEGEKPRVVKYKNVLVGKDEITKKLSKFKIKINNF